MSIPTGRPSGVRLNLRQQDSVRKLIQSNRLVVRLQAYALGRKFQGNEVKMDSNQVRAALGVLRFALPELQNVQLTGDPDNPVAIEHQLGGRAADLLAKVKGGTSAPGR